MSYWVPSVVERNCIESLANTAVIMNSRILFKLQTCIIAWLDSRMDRCFSRLAGAPACLLDGSATTSCCSTAIFSTGCQFHSHRVQARLLILLSLHKDAPKYLRDCCARGVHLPWAYEAFPSYFPIENFRTSWLHFSKKKCLFICKKFWWLFFSNWLQLG